MKNTEYWQREDFNTKGPWLSLPGMKQPIDGAASICVDRLMNAKLEPAAPASENKRRARRSTPTTRVTEERGGRRDMWYFSWVLGLGLACAFAILNAMWFELMDDGRS